MTVPAPTVPAAVGADFSNFSGCSGASARAASSARATFSARFCSARAAFSALFRSAFSAFAASFSALRSFRRSARSDFSEEESSSSTTAPPDACAARSALPAATNSSALPSSAAPSTSTDGKILSSHFGIHHVDRPNRNIDAGINVMRTRNASNRTAAPSAKPKTFTNANGWPMNATNTAIMMIAAAVTTRAPSEKPSTTDSSTALYFDPGRDRPFECVKCSRIRDTRNTW